MPSVLIVYIASVAWGSVPTTQPFIQISWASGPPPMPKTRSRGFIHYAVLNAQSILTCFSAQPFLQLVLMKNYQVSDQCNQLVRLFRRKFWLKSSDEIDKPHVQTVLKLRKLCCNAINLNFCQTNHMMEHVTTVAPPHENLECLFTSHTLFLWRRDFILCNNNNFHLPFFDIASIRFRQDVPSKRRENFDTQLAFIEL